MKYMMLLLVFVSLIFPHSLGYENFGSFSGTVKAEWLPENRQMRLLEDFSYQDPVGKLWGAPKGTVIDGASIPRALWSIVGDPYIGEYRNASVIHDYYCTVKTEAWKKVHRMFYLAMRAGGVGIIRAKVMYAAVYAFGPHWKLVEVEVALSTSSRKRDKPTATVETSPRVNDTVSKTYKMQAQWQEPPDEQAMKSLKDWVEKNDPSLEQIEQSEITTKVKSNEPPSKMMSLPKP